MKYNSAYISFLHTVVNYFTATEILFHYSKLEDENLFEIYSLVVTEENIDQGYEVDLF